MREIASRLIKRALKYLRDIYRYVAFRLSERRGVYEDFAHAKAAVPRGGRIGYDHQDVAQEYRKEFTPTLDSGEYPILFYLNRVLQDTATVLDFGGNIGVHYLRYRSYLQQGSVKWIVCDLPEITKAGRQACTEHPNVLFINEIDEICESRLDVFHASDSVQYVTCLDVLLQKLIDKGLRPANILIDQIPLYDGPEFVTLQNGGHVYYPHYVFNREEFVQSIVRLNYELLDTWTTGSSCTIPFHPDKNVNALSGFYFVDAKSRREVDLNA